MNVTRLLAARLVWIASVSLQLRKKPSILALVGAAHGKGIRSLLTNPMAIKKNLQR